MAILEPTVGQFSRPLTKYFRATRPPFLIASLVPCFIGLAGAAFCAVAITFATALLTALGALLVHAGVNVLNDYYDELNGTDRRNEERLFPFTGGSRFIQNGVLSAGQTARFGFALLAATAVVGLALVPSGGPGLVAVGAVGLLLGWGYSAPPLALNSRGLGELSVGIGFGSLITLGADMVQRGGFDTLPLLLSAPYGLLVAALLYINQFPDRRADEAVGKRHWVVRLGPQRARWGYLLLVLGAYGMLGAIVALVTPWALLGLPAALLSTLAARDLLRHAQHPALLRPAIQRTIAAATLHGVGLSAGLWIAASLPP